MTNKRKYLKNILTTVSLASVIVGSAGSAFGVNTTSLTNTIAGGGNIASQLSNPNHWGTGAGVQAAPAVGAGNFVYVGEDGGLEFDAAIGNLGTLNISGRNTNVEVTKANKLINVINDTAAAAVAFAENGGDLDGAGHTGTVGAVAAPKADFNINFAGIMEFGDAGAGNLSQLGNVTLQHANAVIKISANNAQINGTISGNGGNLGVINVNGNSVQFNGLIGGGNAVKGMIITNNNSAILNTNATFDTVGIGIGDGSTLTINADKDIIGNNGARITATNANNGTLVFEGNSNLNINMNGKALLLTKIGDGKVIAGANVAAINSNEIRFTGANSELALGAANTTITTKTGLTTATGEGVISVNGNNQVIQTAAVGGAAAANQLKAIKFSSDHILTLQTNNAAAVIANGNLGVQNITTNVNNTGTLVLGLGTTLNIINDIGEADKKLKLVTLHSNDGNNNANATFILAEGKKIFATDVALSAAGGTNNTLVLNKDTLVNGNVIAPTADNGIIRVNGDSEITGNIGAVGNKIDAINFNAANILTVGGNYIGANNANGIAFGANNGTLHLTNANNTKVESIIAANNTGKIITEVAANNTTEFAGNIGAAANKLALIEAKKGGNLKFSGGDVYVNNIDIRGQDATVELSKAGGTYVFTLQHDNGQGTIQINEDVTFGEGTKFSADAPAGSTETNPFKKIIFNGDKTATFAKGINIYAGSIETNNLAGNEGNFEFTHDASIIDAQIGLVNKKLNVLTLVDGGAGHATSLELKKDAYFNGGIQLDNDTTLTFSGTNLQAAGIVGAAGNKGTFVLNNDKEATITVNGAPGAPALKAVKISGGDVKLVGIGAFAAAGPVNANALTQTIEFTNANKEATFTLPANVQLNNVTVTTASTTRNHNIKLSANQNITGNIGTLANPFGSLIIDQDKTVKLDGGSKFFGSIVSDNKDQVTVDISRAIAGDANTGKIFGLGNADKRLKNVIFNESATIDGDTFSKDISVADTKIATFNGNVTGDTLMAGDAANGGTAIFTDGARVDTHAKTFTDNKSTLRFLGSATVANLGESGRKFNVIEFTGANKPVVTLGGGAIYSKTLTFGSSAITVDNDTLFSGGTITGNDNTIDLGNSKLTLDSDTTLTGTLNVVLEVDKNLKGGQLILQKSLDIRGVTNANIGLIINDYADLPVDGREITVIDSNNTGNIVAQKGFKANKLLVQGGNKFAKYEPSFVDDKKVKISVKNNAEEEVAKVAANNKFTTEQSQAVGQIAAATSGQALSLVSDWGRMEGTTQAEAMKRDVTPIQNISTVTSELASAVTSVVSTRIATVSGGTPVAIKQVAGDIAGVAAGDEVAKFGAWGSPFYSQATQKMRKGVSGFKSKSFGGTFGFDTLANDTLTIGAAVTVAKTDVKHRNIKAGDKTKVDTVMFSIYAMQNITDNWFAQGIASFGSSKVKNTEIHKTSTAVEKASGKYDSMSYGFEALGGYNYKVSDTATVTPIFGLGYTKFNDTGYKQTGTSNRNFTISKKSSDKFEGILGARAIFATDMNGMTLLPEVHGFVRQNLSSKTPKVSMTIDGVDKPISTKNEKPAKTFFNLGTSVMVKSGTMEYGVGYDAHFANKYVGHQGTLKVRVNF